MRPYACAAPPGMAMLTQASQPDAPMPAPTPDEPLDTSWWQVMTEAEWDAYRPGQHWEPFGAREVERVIAELPGLLAQGAPAFTVLENRDNAAKVQSLPQDEPGVILLACPHLPLTTIVSVRIGGEGNFVDSFYPFMQGAPNVAITLRRALLSPSRCQAILHGSLPDGSEVAFFDLHWGATRSLYRGGAAPEFILGLLAYHCRVIDGPMELPAPAWLAAVRRAAPDALPDSWREGDTIDFNAIDAYVMRPDIAPDEMELWGTVESVERLHHTLRGQGLFKVMASAGGFRLAMFVTDHVAQGRVPQPGERIGAYGWLNGALWWVP